MSKRHKLTPPSRPHSISEERLQELSSRLVAVKKSLRERHGKAGVIQEAGQALAGIQMDIASLKKRKKMSPTTEDLEDRAQVRRALLFKRLSELQSVRAQEKYDELVTKWLVGLTDNLADLKDQRALERLVLDQPRLVNSVDQLKRLIQERERVDKGAATRVSERLQREASRCLRYWKRLLSVEPHRPSDRETWDRMAKATRMRDNNIPWRMISQELSFAGSSAALKQGVHRFRKARKKYLKDFPSSRLHT